MNRQLTEEALRLLKARRPFVRATVVRSTGSVPGKVGATMLYRDDGTTAGTVGGAALEERVKALAADALVRRRGDLVHFDLQRWKEGGLPSLCGGSVDVAVEYVAAPPHLLLWGGGHVAQAIARLLPALEYDYSVADDRPEWITEERFPDAVARRCVAPSDLWKAFAPTEFSHLYLLGYDAMKDLTVLRASLTTFPGYVGVISSHSKRVHMFAELRASGMSEAALARVHAPIGLTIGAESPAEIAVSVVGEIIRDRHLGARPVDPGVGEVETARAERPS